MGVTFREAYDEIVQFSRTSIELHPHAMSALDCNRRCASDAFVIFLSTIALPEAMHYKRLFSCNVFECENDDGERILTGVLIEGAATGVLGEISQFERDEITVLPARKCTDAQFLTIVPFVRY